MSQRHAVKVGCLLGFPEKLLNGDQYQLDVLVLYFDHSWASSVFQGLRHCGLWIYDSSVNADNSAFSLFLRSAHSLRSE